MNYTELVSALKGYAENSFPDTVGNFTTTDQVDTFIQLAEERIYNSVQLPALRKNVTGTLTQGNKYLSCPDDFLSVFSMAIIENPGTSTERYNYLLDKDVSFIRESYPNSTTQGLPQYYALFGPQLSYPTELSFILGPTPSTNYAVELHYFFYPASIVTAGTSWVGDNYNPVLVYGALREAAVFMKSDPDVVKYYEDKYQESLNQLIRLGAGLERGDAYRDGQAKIKVSP